MINSIFEAILQVKPLIVCIMSGITSQCWWYTVIHFICLFFFFFLQILSDVSSRAQHGYDAVVLLALLVNYRKYEVIAQYIFKYTINTKFRQQYIVLALNVWSIDCNISVRLIVSPVNYSLWILTLSNCQ